MKNLNTLGVVIGRFQLHELHEGHVALLDYVSTRHEQMLVLIGHNTIRFNDSDPYPFQVRKQMLESRYPQATILPLKDSPISNEHWSSAVDQKVSSVSESGKAVLYGSRDSFIPKYHGVFPTEEVAELPNRSATVEREKAAGQIIDDSKFRLGWLAAIHAQYTVTDPTVDIAIHTSDFSRVLMGRRGPGAPLRFFGGFVDPDDESYEVAAGREQVEEATGITVGEPNYITSKRIKDPRFGRSKYGLMTTFFAMEYQEGNPVAGDDMGELEWCDLDESLMKGISDTHRGLAEALLRYKKERFKREQLAA